MSEFPEEVAKRAFGRADGRCECLRETHGHSYGMCMKVLEWENRRRGKEMGAWEAHHIISPGAGGKSTESNCEILCWDCYSKTLKTQ